MEYLSKNIEELINETLKRIALGLYVNLNHDSYYIYKKPFKALVVENPVIAFDLIRKSSSVDAAKFIFKIIARALIIDSSKIDFIIDSLEKGNEEPFKEAINKKVH